MEEDCRGGKCGRSLSVEEDYGGGKEGRKQVEKEAEENKEEHRKENVCGGRGQPNYLIERLLYNSNMIAM